MSQAHPTTTPEQCKTDTMMVFDPATGLGPNRELLGRVEVPRYSQPNEDGVRLDTEKQMVLAVSRVIERENTEIRKGDGDSVDPDEMVGWTFLVLDSIDGDIRRVAYEQNPAFDAVWNPEDA